MYLRVDLEPCLSIFISLKDRLQQIFAPGVHCALSYLLFFRVKIIKSIL